MFCRKRLAPIGWPSQVFKVPCVGVCTVLIQTVVAKVRKMRSASGFGLAWNSRVLPSLSVCVSKRGGAYGERTEVRANEVLEQACVATPSALKTESLRGHN